MKLLIVGAVLMTAAIALPVWHILPLLRAVNESVFVAPGSATIEVDEPGRFHLWHNYKMLHEGVNYDRPKHLPDGWSIEITDEAGQPLPFDTGSSSSVQVGNRHKHSLGHVDLASAGTVTVSVSGVAEPDDSAVLSFSRFEMLKMMIHIGIAIVVALVLGAIALGVIICGIVKLVHAGKAMPPPMPISD